MSDLKLAVRALAGGPVAALAVVLSIGLGIGANTIVFAWIDNVLRVPFPAVPDGGSLVALSPADPDGTVQGMPPLDYPTYDEWRRQLASFEPIEAHSPVRLGLRSDGGGELQPVWAELVTPRFFELLRVAPAQGRFFDDRDAADRAPVAVVGDAFWRRHFAGSPDVVGRTVRLSGIPVTLVGVAPAGFGGVVSGLRFDVWVPIWLQPSLLPGPSWVDDRSVSRLQVIGRLRPGLPLNQAGEELATLARRVSAAHGEVPARSAAARYVRDTQLGSLLGPLTTALLAVTLLVLLTGCANVACVLLIGAAARAREAAIQLALGADRGRLVRQGLLQSAILAALGGVLGAWLAWLGSDVLTSFVPRVPLPVAVQMPLNPAVLAFAAALTIGTALVAGVLPALRGSRPDIVTVLKGTSSGASGSSARLRQLLVGGQIACSLAALVTAGLFLRSVQAAGNLPLGFGNPSQVLLVATDFSGLRRAGFDGPMLASQLLDRVRTLPGVEAASLSSMVPLGFGGHRSSSLRVDGYTPAPDEIMSAEKVVVDDGYFDTMQLAIVAGRALDRRDVAAARRSAVVNEAFVAHFWPGSTALGREIDVGDGWATVVGVCRNAATRDLGENPFPITYVAFAQAPVDGMTLHARASVAPKTLIEGARRAFVAVHPDLPFLDPGTLAEHMAASTFVQSVGSSVVGAFGAVALLMAGLGLYGVLASYVSERRREIAISMAIGASPGRVLAWVLRAGGRPAAGGLAAGLGLALVLGRIARSQLVGVTPFDATTILGSVAALTLMVLIVCVTPAWRALRTDPAATLRGE